MGISPGTQTISNPWIKLNTKNNEEATFVYSLHYGNHSSNIFKLIMHTTCPIIALVILK